MKRAFAALIAATALSASTAHAADIKLCVLDAQSALNETKEGKAAQKRLETLFASKQTELENMQKELQKQFEDYEQRKLILSDSAKQEQERTLMEKQQKLQMSAMQAEQEMQQTYMQLLSGMEEKLLSVAEALGAKKGCTLLVPKEATIYVGPGVVDLTSEVIVSLDGN